ncbi:MAG: 3-oxoacyl-ACP synthase, partial [Verrucomicrobia bacterium]|nr:3-oxoacyl-ACP synthase [Verrucomicrobiota bacterium]
DGAGAAVLRAGVPGRGIIGTVAGSDGTLAGLLHIPGGGSRSPSSHETIDQRLHYLKMQGNEVFKHAVRCMCDASQEVLERHGLKAEDVKWVVPHQANLRIIQAIAQRLGIGMERFCLNLDQVGNMSSASIPVALDEAVRAGRIQNGDLVLFVAFGGGFTWGASVIEWHHGK